LSDFFEVMLYNTQFFLTMEREIDQLLTTYLTGYV